MTNKIHLTGRLGRDPQLSQNGGFTLLVADERVIKKGDERVSVTSWHNVIVTKSAEADYIAKHLKTGLKASIQGELQYRERENAEIKEAVIVVSEESSIEICQ